MAKIEFTEEQEKALIKFFSKHFGEIRCSSCKHENGSTYPLSKTCSNCKDYSKWKPNKYRVQFVKGFIDEIKLNK